MAVTTTAIDLDPREYEHYTDYTHDPSEKNEEHEFESDNDVDTDDDEDNANGDRSFDHFAENNTVGKYSFVPGLSAPFTSRSYLIEFSHK